MADGIKPTRGIVNHHEGKTMRDNLTAFDTFCAYEPEAIIVHHGRMRVAFPAGTPQSEIDKRLKKMDANVSAGRKPDTRLKMPKLTRLKSPSVGMVKDAGFTVPDDGKLYVKGVTHRYMAAGKPLVVLPAEVLRDAQIATCHRELAKLAKEDPHTYATWEARRADGSVAKISTERLREILASILRPGGRLTGQYAASVVYGLDELARRENAQVSS